MIFYTKSDRETEEVGRDLARLLDEGNIKRAFIAMRGEMGVGKTAFTRGFASYFDIDGVRSPTYTVVNEYSGKRRIFHFDMYRITDGDDLYSIGYDDYVESDGYSIVEWSENIEDFIPEDAITVTISRTSEGEGERVIEINYDNSGI
jgi:tRNA threonylcarbamoyladenosine biosynthesis protein TsaE